MGQIKNIKLHIVTDIKLLRTQHDITTGKNGCRTSSRCSHHPLETTEELGTSESRSCNRNRETTKRAEGETRPHLQTCRQTREGIPRERTRRDPTPTHGETGRKLLRSRGSKTRVRDSHPRYQPGVPEGEESAATVTVETDQQRSVCEAEQMLAEHVAVGRTVRRVGVPEPEDDSRSRVQARIR